MVIVDNDPGDEHIDAPAFHYPGGRMRLLWSRAVHDSLANGHAPCSNEAWFEAYRYADCMRHCCELCAGTLEEDGS